MIAGKGNDYVRLVTSTDADSGMSMSLAAFDASPSTNTLLEFRRDAVTGASLQKSVTVNIVVDNSLVDAYNTGYIDSYNAEVDEYNDNLDVNGDGVDDLDPKDYLDYLTPLPASVYTLESNTVTFAPGEFAKYVSIHLNPATLSFTKQYAVGVKVNNPSSDYKISEAGNESLVKVVIKNQYDGEYHSTGYFSHPTSPRDIDKDKTLSTRGASEVETELADLTPRTMRIIINSDNTLQINENGSVSPVGATLVPGDPVYNNKYDPATKTFYLKYAYGAGRLITEAIKKK